MQLSSGLLCTLVLVAAAGLVGRAQAKQPPHVVLVVADDLGWNDVGWHAGSDCLTPHLDALAASGLQLDQMYVQHICSPTRSALMSSKYPIHTGLSHGVIRPTSPYGLPLAEVTLAQEMRSAGYATHAVGKWHLGFYAPPYLPTARGFDSYYGYLLGAEDYYAHNRSYNGVGGYDLRNGTAPVTDAGGTYSAHLFTSVAQGIVNGHAAKARATAKAPAAAAAGGGTGDAHSGDMEPLFLYLPYQSVHDPAQAPERYIAPYRGKSKPEGRAVKCGMVAALDEGVANLTATLKANGMWNDTLFIFTTDNGGPVGSNANNFPLRGSKATLWEGGVRGAAFVNGGVLPPALHGRQTDALMHVTDWLPTLLGLIGRKPSGKDLDGVDQSAVLTTPGASSARTTILHNIDPLSCGMQVRGGVCGAVRQGDWKLMIGGELGDNTWYTLKGNNHPAGHSVKCGSHFPKVNASDCSKTHEPCLFNIAQDPCEHNNVAPANPAKVTELLALLAQFNATLVPPAQSLPQNAPDPKGADPSKHGGFWGPWRSSPQAGEL